MAQARKKTLSFWDKIRKLRKSTMVYTKKYCNSEFVLKAATDVNNLWLAAIVLLCAEVFVNIFVIQYVKYTEIDWIAYMQEVEGFLNGTWDYVELKGDTGPLVYPAGFIYIFSAFYMVTDNGKNIRRAQYIFAALYLVVLFLVFRIYCRSKKIPPYALVFLCCTSYRVHSIFILRLFNDPVAMLFLYLAINMFLDSKWSLGSLFYSIGVSIKMNILLFSPALLLAYFACLGYIGTLKQLFICAIVQVVLAAPFLMVNPTGYLLRAFDLGRIFLFKWTVNWRFLPEEIFVHRYFHISVLALHMLIILFFWRSWYRHVYGYKTLESANMNVTSQLLILPLFSANFIGVACSRSLHYQFYVWYFHSLPYLLWSVPILAKWRLCILGIIEMCWNTYPSTIYSSAALHLCHLVIFWGLCLNRNPHQFLENAPIMKKRS